MSDKDVDKISSFLDKFDIPELRQLFDEIINSSNIDYNQAQTLYRKINELNPWKENFKDNYCSDYPSLAYEDIPFLLQKGKDSQGLLHANIEELKKEISQFGILKDKSESFERLIEDGVKAPFQDYEQAFDGNLINPKVLILGINPKFVMGHETYKLNEVYKEPFNAKRPPLTRAISSSDKVIILKRDSEEIEIHQDDYYFGKNKFFYKENDKDDKESLKSLYDDHRYNSLSNGKETPFALIEFFPYASHSEDYWITFGKIAPIALKISGAINKYVQLEELLYSQQWLLCMIALVIKRNKNKGLKIFLRKNNKDFMENVFAPLLELLEFDKENIYIKTPKQRNIKLYYDRVKVLFDKVESGEKNGETWGDNEVFFNELWHDDGHPEK